MNPLARLALVTAGLLLLAPRAVRAEGPDHAIVAGFERIAQGQKSDAVQGGLVLLGDLNCTSCHKGEADASAHLLPKSAPILDAVGTRVRPEAIRAFLLDPQRTKPGTTMPNVLARLPEAERLSAVENLTHFLASTGRAPSQRVDARSALQGRTLYHEVGCVACHGPREGANPLPTSVPLGPVAAKYTLPSLSAFLSEPHRARPSGRMPSLNLNRDEARAIAAYLLRSDTAEDASAANDRPNLAFSTYEGDWSKLPDFDALTPKAKGQSAGFDLTKATRSDNIAMRFEGFVQIDREGDYTLHATSDDGSKVWIDGQPVADADGIHPAQSGAGRIHLTKGPHRIVVGYFNGGGESELSVEIESDVLARQPIDPYLSLTEERPKNEAKAAGFEPDASKAERGRALFASLGCASCHQMKRNGKAIESGLAAPSLAGLQTDRGCLATAPSDRSPRFALNASQRDALSAAIRFVKEKPEAPSDRAMIGRTLTAFNCYACHTRDGVGGVEDARKEFFQTTYADLGDEGRFPPHLNGVGAKLTRNWIEHVLNDGAKDRPYMKTRMPKFGGGGLGDLAERLQKADPLAPAPAVALDATEKKIKSIGRHLVGTRAFGCVQCHNFRGEQSQGIPAIDMTLMTRRLNHDWFVRYVVDPPAYRPGTRMPSAWPKEESQLADILDGSSAKQIEAVWQYLLDGPGASLPYGAGRSPIPLVAEAEPYLYRGFIEGAGTRAIAVGFPEGANLAFDANAGRVAMIWRGAFFDASRHWTGRGEGFQPPLGDEIVRMDAGPTLAQLPDPRTPWPREERDEEHYKFRGYRLDKLGRPTFLFRAGPLSVEDAFTAAKAGEEPTLQRVVSIQAHGDAPGLFYRAATGSKIEPAKADGWFRVDGEYSTRVEGGASPVVRESGGRKELLVPVKPEGGRARITQTYRW